MQDFAAMPVDEIGDGGFEAAAARALQQENGAVGLGHGVLLDNSVDTQNGLDNKTGQEKIAHRLETEIQSTTKNAARTASHAERHARGRAAIIAPVPPSSRRARRASATPGGRSA